MSLVLDLLSLRHVVDTAQVPLSGRRDPCSPSWPGCRLITGDSSILFRKLPLAKRCFIAQGVIEIWEEVVTSRREWWAEKGHLRISVGFGNIEAVGGFGKRSVRRAKIWVLGVWRLHGKQREGAESESWRKGRNRGMGLLSRKGDGVSEGTRMEKSPGLTGGWGKGAQAWLSEMVGSGVRAKSTRLCPPRCLSSFGFWVLPCTGHCVFCPRSMDLAAHMGVLTMVQVLPPCLWMQI